MAFVRKKKIKGTWYYYLVQSTRVGDNVKKVEKYLGREKPTEKELKKLNVLISKYLAEAGKGEGGPHTGDIRAGVEKALQEWKPQVTKAPTKPAPDAKEFKAAFRADRARKETTPKPADKSGWVELKDRRKWLELKSPKASVKKAPEKTEAPEKAGFDLSKIKAGFARFMKGKEPEAAEAPQGGRPELEKLKAEVEQAVKEKEAPKKKGKAEAAKRADSAKPAEEKSPPAVKQPEKKPVPDMKALKASITEAIKHEEPGPAPKETPKKEAPPEKELQKKWPPKKRDFDVKKVQASIAKALKAETPQVLRVPREHVITGVPGFDSLLTRGIPRGATILVAGGAGSGKTIFCLQTLAHHAAQGKKCYYISFEESTERLISHMRDFGWEPDKLIDAGNLVIERYSPFHISRTVEAMLAKEKGELLIDVDPVVLPEGFIPEFIVLDSLTAVGSVFVEKEDSYRIYIEQLFRFFEHLGCTSFLITETEQVPEIFSTAGVEEFLADGVIVFYNIKREGGMRENAVEVLKMRGEHHQKRMVAMQVSDRGITVYPEQEVFGGTSRS